MGEGSVLYWLFKPINNLHRWLWKNWRLWIYSSPNKLLYGFQVVRFVTIVFQLVLVISIWWLAYYFTSLATSGTYQDADDVFRAIFEHLLDNKPLPELYWGLVLPPTGLSIIFIQGIKVLRGRTLTKAMFTRAVIALHDLTQESMARWAEQWQAAGKRGLRKYFETLRRIDEEGERAIRIAQAEIALPVDPRSIEICIRDLERLIIDRSNVSRAPIEMVAVATLSPETMTTGLMLEYLVTTLRIKNHYKDAQCVRFLLLEQPISEHSPGIAKIIKPLHALADFYFVPVLTTQPRAEHGEAVAALLDMQEPSGDVAFLYLKLKDNSELFYHIDKNPEPRYPHEKIWKQEQLILPRYRTVVGKLIKIAEGRV